MLPVSWEFWDSPLQAEPPAAPGTIPGFPAISPSRPHKFCLKIGICQASQTQMELGISIPESPSVNRAPNINTSCLPPRSIPIPGKGASRGVGKVQNPKHSHIPKLDPNPGAVSWPDFSSNENPALVMCAPESFPVPTQGQVEIKRIQESQGTIATTSWDGQGVPNLISLALLPAVSSESLE